jgi:AcrR family transcriptional regulator
VETLPTPTRERQRGATRDLILRAARREVAAVGLAKARIGRIAQLAGVTRPTIYAHFPRKEDFLLAVQADSEGAALDGLRKRLGNAGGAALIHRLADALFDLVETGDPMLRRESFALMIREPQSMDWAGNPLFEYLAERLGESQTRGELTSTVAPTQLIRLILTALFGFVAVENEPAPARRNAAHQMLDLLIDGATT